MDERTDEINRLCNDSYKEHLHNLNVASHNHLRITISLINDDVEILVFRK